MIPVAWIYENKNVKGNWYIKWTEPPDGFNKRPLYEHPPEVTELRQQLASRDAEIAELRQQLDAMTTDLNRVSEEFGLPKGIGPATGEIKRILSDLRQQLAASQQALSKVYELWAGVDGMPQPEDEVGWYLFQLVEKMRDAAKEGVK